MAQQEDSESKRFYLLVLTNKLSSEACMLCCYATNMCGNKKKFVPVNKCSRMIPLSVDLPPDWFSKKMKRLLLPVKYTERFKTRLRDGKESIA